jgi:hypothetical protein
MGYFVAPSPNYNLIVLGAWSGFVGPMKLLYSEISISAYLSIRGLLHYPKLHSFTVSKMKLNNNTVDINSVLAG